MPPYPLLPGSKKREPPNNYMYQWLSGYLILWIINSLIFQNQRTTGSIFKKNQNQRTIGSGYFQKLQRKPVFCFLKIFFFKKLREVGYIWDSLLWFFLENTMVMNFKNHPDNRLGSVHIFDNWPHIGMYWCFCKFFSFKC